MGVSFNDASGYGINHNLTPFDIQAGGNPWVIWQGLGDSGSEEGRGGKEGIVANTGTGKNDQVPLGRPLCSRHLNIGVNGIGRKHSITHVDQNRGCSCHLGTKGLDKCMLCEAEHEARPRRWRGVLGMDLGHGGFRATGGFGGPGAVFAFMATLAKDTRCHRQSPRHLETQSKPLRVPQEPPLKQAIAKWLSDALLSLQ